MKQKIIMVCLKKKSYTQSSSLLIQSNNVWNGKLNKLLIIRVENAERVFLRQNKVEFVKIEWKKYNKNFIALFLAEKNKFPCFEML